MAVESRKARRRAIAHLLRINGGLEAAVADLRPKPRRRIRTRAVVELVDRLIVENKRVIDDLT